MALVVADTGPLHYLTLVDEAMLLPRLFGRVLIPAGVRDELLHLRAPLKVRNWMANPPGWLAVASVQASDDADLHRLDHGEKEAIMLALELRANLLLMDDREGATAARRKGLAVIGTLGVLDAAARQGLTDIGAVVTRLKTTNFRYPPELIDGLILRYRKGEAS